MSRSRYFALAVATVVTFPACGESERLMPTAPSSIGAPTTAPQSRGEISVIHTGPDSSGTLAVRDCMVDGIVYACTDGWRGAFEVVSAREVPFPVLVLTFYAGAEKCAVSVVTQALLPAGTTTFEVAELFLSGPQFTSAGGGQPCTLPVTTDRIAYQVWSDSDWSFNPQGELRKTYTLTRVGDKTNDRSLGSD